MNPNTEYEKFAQEVYRELAKTDVVKTIDVKHNILLTGRSGQKHQIDVYWEYEKSGIKTCVAIECKNYNSTVPIGKVRDFFGVLYDLDNVAGIMVTKIGFQKGAKEYANHYGIGLKELRIPNVEECTIGQTELYINISVRHCLFLIDEQYSETNKFSLSRYKQRLDIMDVKHRWCDATHVPLEIKDRNIRDAEGRIISSLDELEKGLPENGSNELAATYKFVDAYVETCYCGTMKIKEVKYEYENENQTTLISIDVHEFVKAILKDVMTGEIKLITKTAK